MGAHRDTDARFACEREGAIRETLLHHPPPPTLLRSDAVIGAARSAVREAVQQAAGARLLSRSSSLHDEKQQAWRVLRCASPRCSSFVLLRRSCRHSGALSRWRRVHRLLLTAADDHARD
jgi:hypothetical protein